MLMHQELWQMSEELENSLVKAESDDRPEQIKRSLQNTKPIDEMSKYQCIQWKPKIGQGGRDT